MVRNRVRSHPLPEGEGICHTPSKSNKLIYDEGTESLGRFFRGEPAVGELVGSGIVLAVLPLVLTTWSEWVKDHPDTTVLDIRTGVYPVGAYLSESDSGTVYFSLRTSEETMFPVPQRSKLLTTKSRVLGLTLNGVEKAYPQETLSQLPVVNDEVGGVEIVVVTPDGGDGSRAFQRGGYTFVELGQEPGDEGSLFLVADAEGVWDVTEADLELRPGAVAQGDIQDPSSLGERLPRLPSRFAF